MTKYLRLTPVPGENPIERFVAGVRDSLEWVETVSEATVITITDAKSIKAKLSQQMALETEIELCAHLQPEDGLSWVICARSPVASIAETGSKIGPSGVAASLTGGVKETGLSGLIVCPVPDTPK
jgi:hypothetical protein